MNKPIPKTAEKPTRNAPCPCGSGKKYKTCCFTKSSNAVTISEALQNAWSSVRQQNITQTLYWFKQALSIEPKNLQALAGMGQALCWHHQRNEGLDYLRKAANQLERNARQTRDIRFIIELAEQLHHWGDLDTALKLTKLALDISPENPAALNNHALYLSRVNRCEEALPYAIKANQLLPENPACSNLLGVLHAQLKHYSEAKQFFSKIIETNRDKQQTARAWQELVTVLDKLGEYEQSFQACQQAKQHYLQLPEVQSIDKNAVFKAISTNKAGFDRALLQRWTTTDFADHQPQAVFLLGFLRSGTTLTEQVLGAHPDIFTSDENDLIHSLTEELKRLSGEQSLPQALQRIDIQTARQLRGYYWRRVNEEYGARALDKLFINKVALNSIDIGLISCLFPEARLLFALRDPRDVCLSCFQQAFKPATVTVNLMTWEGVARQYSAVMDLWLYLKPMIQPRYLELRYEDTVNDFENSFRQVFELLDLTWSSEIRTFHEKTKGRFIATPSFAAVNQPMYQHAVARWKHYPDVFDQILPILEPFIQAFGYDCHQK